MTPRPAPLVAAASHRRSKCGLGRGAPEEELRERVLLAAADRPRSYKIRAGARWARGAGCWTSRRSRRTISLFFCWRAPRRRRARRRETFCGNGPVLRRAARPHGDMPVASSCARLWKSTSELGYPELLRHREPPRHRAAAVTETTSRRWRGTYTPSSRCSDGDAAMVATKFDHHARREPATAATWRRAGERVCVRSRDLRRLALPPTTCGMQARRTRRLLVSSRRPRRRSARRPRHGRVRRHRRREKN